MDFDHYQEVAALTDQFAGKKSEKDLMIPLLGLAGETGTLLSEFKKKIRDKESYEGFERRAVEELGDVLWYVANIASRLDLSLSEIAAKNLHKTQERWPFGSETAELHPHFDDAYPIGEQLPRVLDIRVYEGASGARAKMEFLPDKIVLGDTLTDNAYQDDGYRFHDVLHLGHLAVLGWSPVLRGMLGRKRKSNPTIDRVEDGARAAVLEELIVAFVYTNAQDRRYYQGIRHVDSELLATIKRLVDHLEVRARRMRDWELAILKGYAAFRHILKSRDAVFRVDLDKRDLLILK
jgi:NTP pyrophosphatase (non-canonical NTP hydrolase)